MYEQKSKCRLQGISGCFEFVQTDISRDMIHVHEATDGDALFLLAILVISNLWVTGEYPSTKEGSRRS